VKWFLLLVMFFPTFVLAGEYCADDYRGICRYDCLQDETPADGGFIDCDDKQVCCIENPGQDKKD
jgi:hypothetical protein